MSKCNNSELLKKKTNEWLQNNAKINNQTILDDLQREYTLKNKQIKLIFCYSNEKLSIAIDNDISSLKTINVKGERDPFTKPEQ